MREAEERIQEKYMEIETARELVSNILREQFLDYEAHTKISTPLVDQILLLKDHIISLKEQDLKRRVAKGCKKMF